VNNLFLIKLLIASMGRRTSQDKRDGITPKGKKCHVCLK
jgi:hypothetical protein